MHLRTLLKGCDTDQTSELELFSIFFFNHGFLQHLMIMVHGAW